ncbi:hypothetical protein LTR99_004076 [Exophiala xenobiotica]|uniref:Redoxin domain-containing protein n=1 Tax=Vermiconidia calcicola TaxID=1690605 RepID=A0AAV9QKX5_9PEZI|nr:hypothetical protein LTR92_008156 [Exophiala xenobiotica]KAK5545162.1 hypothetical protein LTR25_000169 [Vermiconidia calcicola]KAK5549192.1 hypothetical protein LTR23_001022 [Chaetothyriales sp. CCFEE 6169]KAK5207964.1 hypothetical protein LTR41_006476 [Exophiala xenobiotica]KAK5220043.1 hypothetical protein LTR72_007574 [Exophiala xenobiotica]
MAHTTFPSDLPVPEDDGLYNHLTDFKIPADINLPVASDPSKKNVNLAELKELTVVFCYPRTGVSRIYGISTQSPDYQAEVHKRLHLPYDLLSDENLAFQRGLNLPTFEWEGEKVLRRSMIAIQDGMVIKWWYPVFPPDRGVDDLIAWLKER